MLNIHRLTENVAISVIVCLFVSLLNNNLFLFVCHRSCRLSAIQASFRSYYRKNMVLEQPHYKKPLNQSFELKTEQELLL